MARDKVTVVCADVSINCLSRALTLAEIISLTHNVQITGFARSYRKIWPPAVNSKVPVKILPFGSIQQWFDARNTIARIARECKLIICKPRLMSMGLALQAGINPEGVLLDINDWELGLALGSRRVDGHFHYRQMLTNLASPNSPLLTLHYEKKIGIFPHRLVNNRWLQQRFGGELLYDVRDTDRLNPENYDKKALRISLGLDDRPWIIFAGTPRPHKGLHVLLAALAEIHGDNAPGLMCCGGGSDSARHRNFINDACQLLGPARVFHAGSYNREEAANYLAAADIACVPARMTSNSIGQVPTKLFEALAMGLPVIVSDICDMADLIRGAGLSVPSEDSTALANAIKTLADDPAIRRQFGLEARRRAVEQYSYHAARPVLDVLLQRLA
ncbi:MAG TPA: glycosyltransferase [Gammaproteobacteria bacterium]|nr:glycosyltransferase [Gammaproteobacteria bacterium]